MKEKKNSYLTSYFHSLNNGTIPNFIAGKNWIFCIIHCMWMYTLYYFTSVSSLTLWNMFGCRPLRLVPPATPALQSLQRYLEDWMKSKSRFLKAVDAAK